MRQMNAPFMPSGKVTCPYASPMAQASQTSPSGMYCTPQILHKPSYPLALLMMLGTVKNGFSDPTKEQEGRDRPRKDIMNRRQAKALREGCRERKEARTGVSSREKINTNRNLVRVTTKSKSEMQTVSNGRVGREGRDGCFEEHPNIGDLIE